METAEELTFSGQKHVLSRAREKRLSIVAVLPGPKNGMTLMTEVIVEALRENYQTREYDIGSVFHQPGKTWVLRKAIRSVASALRIMTWKPEPGESLYLVLNAGGGLVYNLAQVLAARARGFHVVLHHHVWSYLSKYDWRMKLITQVSRQETVHAVHCPEMAQSLRSLYGKQIRCAFVTPSIVGLPEIADHKRREGQGDFTIGMLANLTLEKGLGESIATLRSLLSQGLQVRLVLGGPAASEQSKQVIDQAQAEFGDRFTHLGPVYGHDKLEFFSQLDAFVFPTKYRNESWGIVLNEALMAAVPVITCSRGCIGYLVGEGGGLVVDHEAHYVERATKLITEWIREPAEHERARNDAFKRGRELRIQAESQLAHFSAAFETGRWPGPDGRELT